MSYHGILRNKKERTIDTYGMDDSPKTGLSEKSQSLKIVYCIISFIEHS